MVLGGLVGFTALQEEADESKGIPVDDDLNVGSNSNLWKFSSYQEIQDFLNTNAEFSGSYYKNYSGVEGPTIALEGRDFGAEAPSAGSGDFSTTNIQVEGVDEGDIVKNDGKYAYIVSRNKTEVFIIDVYPAEDARILTIIEFNWTINEIYISNGKMVVLGTNSDYYHYDYYIRPGYYSYCPETYIMVYDIEDKENPVLTRSVTLKGNYISSRIIGDYFYIIVSQPTYYIENESDLPVPANEIYFADVYDYSYSYTNVVSINVQNEDEEPNNQVILLGTSNRIYVSLSNIYLTYIRWISWAEREERRTEEVLMPILPQNTSKAVDEVRNSDLMRYEKLNKIDDIVEEYIENLTGTEKWSFYLLRQVGNQEFEQRISRESELTIIHRIAIENGDIMYEASGAVPGHTLNRYSMDEHQEHFRVATTTGQSWRSGDGGSKNHVYVLDMDLKIVGRLNDIAPGESIYSARFMGNRAYLVTFKKVDPFFVIDLSNPYQPEILGELKIPGYSNYLHPYDENHVIGIGKDAVDMDDFPWYQGVKISLFDVTDVHNPKEVSQFIIGDRGTESIALSEPKAFLFSRSKELLVIPVSVAEIDESKYEGEIPPSAYGEIVYDGAYIFHISDKSGIELKGMVTHFDDDDEIPSHYYYYSSKKVKRSFYINDVLYTVSDYLVKANNLENLNEINTIELPE